MQEDLINTENDVVPVYLFTGFLEAGKTKFIQETLSDKRFNRGEKTLVLLCEEGEEELEKSKYRQSGKSVSIQTVETINDLTPENMEKWQKECGAERVLIEYNGTWMLDDLYRTMPEGWTVYQEFMFANALTFINYNANMRQLVYDKLKSCELVVFNRAPNGMPIEEFHKIVRAVNRSCDIAFEHPDGKIEYDEIVDPLPFDIDAPIVEINDKDYAIWYRDICEELKKYDGKTIKIKAQMVVGEGIPDNCYVVGRQMMNCCANDLQFAGLIAEGSSGGNFKPKDWVVITAKIKVQRHEGYDKVGPVLHEIALEPAEAPADEVATFY